MPVPAVASSARFAFEEHGGRLYRMTDSDVIVMLPWPMMKAFRKRRPNGTYASCVPPFAIPPDLPDSAARPDNPADPATPGQPDIGYEGLAEIRLFCQQIPAPVRQTVSLFRERHWQLLAWLAGSGSVGEQLLAANPSLAFAVACGAEMTVRETPTRFLEKQFLMAYRSQVDLLGRLGFPSTERARRILRKIAPQAVTLARLRRLREWLRDAALSERLAHTPILNDAVLTLVETGAHAATSNATLQQVARENLDDATDIARRLADAVRLWGLVRPTTPLPHFTSVERIREVYAELHADAAKARREPHLFPPTPVAGNESILPIRSMAMLLEEGRLQSNCVATYAEAIRRGHTVVYRVLSPERCTLSIRWRRGQWVIGELKRSANRSASFETYMAVNRWLAHATANVRDSFMKSLTPVEKDR